MLLVLCLSAKLLSLGVLAGQAATGFEARDAVAVASAAAGLRAVNVIEPHKAPFAEGDARVLAGDFEAARQLFEEALAFAGPDDECVIRVNLVLSIEQLGDARLAAKDATAAGKLFAEGLAVVEGAPEGCLAAPVSCGDRTPPRTRGRSWNRPKPASGRNPGTPRPAVAKAQAARGQQSGDAGRRRPATQTRLEQLNDSARNSQLERNNGQERDEYLRDGDYSSGPDKPW